MTRRTALPVVALAAALAVVPSASAAPLCNFIADKRGDQALGVAATSPLVPPDLDIVSADVGVNAKHVVAVVRVASLVRFDPRYPLGREYSMLFVVDDTTHFTLAALISPAETTAWMYGGGGGYKPATVTVDYAKAEIRIAAASLQFGKPPVHRSELSEFEVVAAAYAGTAPYTRTTGPLYSSGTGGFGWTVDTATTERTFRGGTPTCVVMPG